jgi:hypothetical protein
VVRAQQGQLLVEGLHGGLLLVNEILYQLFAPRLEGFLIGNEFFNIILRRAYRGLWEPGVVFDRIPWECYSRSSVLSWG